MCSGDGLGAPDTVLDRAGQKKDLWGAWLETSFCPACPKSLWERFWDATEDALLMDNVVSLVEAGCIDVQITF
jgi:hypothetical protein